MKIYKVRSEYECLVKNEETEALLDQNSSLTFEKPEKLLIYPLSQSDKNRFPFVLDLGSLNDSPFFKSFSLNEYELIYITNLSYVKNEIIEKVENRNINTKINLSQETLCFESESEKKLIPLNHPFDSYSITTNGDFIFVLLKGKLENLWIFNAKTKLLKHLEGRKIEIIDNRIIISKELNDIARHTLYETYEIKDDEIKKHSQDLKAVDRDFSLIKNNSIVPIAFLQAIKLGDFTLALQYLDQQTFNNVSPQHFQAFFKDFSTIIPLENHEIGLLNNDKLKIFRFEVLDGKIKEILPNN